MYYFSLVIILALSRNPKAINAFFIGIFNSIVSWSMKLQHDILEEFGAFFNKKKKLERDLAIRFSFL